MNTSATPTASYTYANWQRARNGDPAQATSEAMLFTDTWVTGEVPELGPYAFINTIAHASIQPGKIIQPAVAMRVTHHHQETPQGPTTSMVNDFEHYHGGDYVDEMAAMASLCAGVRLKAGGVTRQFEKDGDRFGRPVQYSGKPDPQFLLEGQPQIPRLTLPFNLNDCLRPLTNFPERTVAQTNAFIKAARQYQQAIWIADSDPTLAWLMLVSAIETVALEWKSDSPPVEQLGTAFPELVKLIRESKSPELLEPVAGILKQLTHSTKRFVGFIEAFAPPAPAERPAPYMQISYEKPDLRKAASLIYRHRSQSLHRGTAFPAPMCQPPRYASAGQNKLAVQEKPFGLATSSRNASWTIDKTPMLINAFEHIARGAILNWWRSLEQQA